MNSKNNNKMKRYSVITAILAIIIILFTPNISFAATIGFQTMIGAIQNILTTLVLPIAIVFAAWQLIYIAVVGGILGMDPLGMINDKDSDGQLSWAEIKSALLMHISGFVKGLMWIGGVFIIFQLVLGLASGLAGIFENSFG